MVYAMAAANSALLLVKQSCGEFAGAAASALLQEAACASNSRWHCGPRQCVLDLLYRASARGDGVPRAAPRGWRWCAHRRRRLSSPRPSLWLGSMAALAWRANGTGLGSLTCACSDVDAIEVAEMPTRTEARIKTEDGSCPTHM